MKLEEAIKTLKAHSNTYFRFYDQKLYDAEQLGIEALNRVLLYRKGMYIGLGDKMPGETKY